MLIDLLQNAISLPPGLQVTPNMFFLRNDQGQVMLMAGQPQAVAGGGTGEVRLQQSAGTTVFRVCGRGGTCLTFSNYNHISIFAVFHWCENCFANCKSAYHSSGTFEKLF